jgi:hypothetical protein
MAQELSCHHLWPWLVWEVVVNDYSNEDGDHYTLKAGEPYRADGGKPLEEDDQ